MAWERESSVVRERVKCRRMARDRRYCSSSQRLDAPRICTILRPPSSSARRIWRLGGTLAAQLPALVAPAVKEPVPPRVEATLAQRLFIGKAGLPSSLINALRRIAAFQNPDFYEKQRLRLSTARIPRIICRAEDFPRHGALPRGCVDDATALLQPLGATVEIDDQREDGHPIEHRFCGTLTELQEHAVRALRAHDIGVLVAPPGVGKTVAGIRMIAERAPEHARPGAPATAPRTVGRAACDVPRRRPEDHWPNR